MYVISLIDPSSEALRFGFLQPHTQIDYMRQTGPESSPVTPTPAFRNATDTGFLPSFAKSNSKNERPFASSASRIVKHPLHRNTRPRKRQSSRVNQPSAKRDPLKLPRLAVVNGIQLPVADLETINFSRLAVKEPDQMSKLLRVSETQGFY